MKMLIKILLFFLIYVGNIETYAQGIHHHIGIRFFTEQYNYLNFKYQHGNERIVNPLSGLTYYATINKYRLGIESFNFIFTKSLTAETYDIGLLNSYNFSTYTPFIGYNLFANNKNKIDLLTGWMVIRKTGNFNLSILNKPYDPNNGRFSAETFLAKGSLMLGLEGSREIYKNFTLDARLSFTHQMIPMKFFLREWDPFEPQVNFDPRLNFITFQITLGYNFGHNKP